MISPPDRHDSAERITYVMVKPDGTTTSASCTTSPESVETAAFREQYELAYAESDPLRARAAVRYYIERCPQDQLDALVTMMGALWDDFPAIDTCGNRREIAGQVVAYLAEADREDDA